MTNIWGFLLQTLSVSLVAVLFLIVKRLLADKLSPRWQYGVWSILALRILLPVTITRYILLPLPLWIETWKATTEHTLHSTYSATYTPISLKHVLPIFHGKPTSITDWLLVIYAFGILLCLLWYILSYCRLRLLLHHGTPVSADLKDRIQALCKKYNLKSCHTVTVKGLSSAFICGIIHPVLAVPAKAEIDDKILLHELLHLKHHDALQNIGWCILRTLHWCNPFLQYVFHRIGNDMESLCDQRVLERLEGEERREYGLLLLNMANEKYARAPGTTSISNGGKNISRRIAAIVRFQKYPRGMALVSICIIVALMLPALSGTANAYNSGKYSPVNNSGLNQAMAMARIRRCTTMSGALDTYAKGLMLENGIYIATASSLSRHEALAAEMYSNSLHEGWSFSQLESGRELDCLNMSNGYRIFNLEEKEDHSYQALLAFGVTGFWDVDKEEWTLDENGEEINVGTVLIPVSVRYEDAWVVEETGERITSFTPLDSIAYTQNILPEIAQFSVTGKTGTIVIKTLTQYTIENSISNSQTNIMGGLFNTTTFDETLKPDAAFEYTHIISFVEYSLSEDATSYRPQETMGILITPLDSIDEKVEFPDSVITIGGGSSSDNFDWNGIPIRENADFSVGCTCTYTKDDIGNEVIPLPAAYGVQVFWDAKVVEEITVEEVQGK